MTYTLHTLSDEANPVAPEPSAGRAWSRGAVAVLLLVASLWWALALASFSLDDPAWSSTGQALGADRLAQTAMNRAGWLGAWVADLSYLAFGRSVWWLVLAVLLGALGRIWASLHTRAATSARGPGIRALGLGLLLCASCALEWSRLYQWEPGLPGPAGGILGYALGGWSVQALGFTGSGLTWVALGLLGAAWGYGFSWSLLAERLGQGLERAWQAWRHWRDAAQDRALGQQAARARGHTLGEGAAEPSLSTEAQSQEPQPNTSQEATPATLLIEPTVLDLKPSQRVVRERQKPLFAELGTDRLPRVDLLDDAPARQEGVTPETLDMTSRLIEKKLKDFGVEVRVVAAAPGPVITRYEIEPATGVKGSQVVNLAKDLARSLSLVSIRVIETIPGKNYMALELPNTKRQSIRLSEILGSEVYNKAKSVLTLGLGKDIVGNAVVADLTQMPHVLVAGTTGAGKSVGLNAMILSLLYKADPRDVRLLMIDPKMLELSVYEGIGHLLAPVVTDMKQAANGLNWCVGEMERRYRLMSKLGVRGLPSFNAKLAEARARGEFIYNPFSLTPEQPEPLEHLPFIVIIIDELADLIMVEGKKIEELIARLAQKARAAGIHLILATQRPSVDVITGLIKANIRARMAFQVSSKIDSRTILDQMGAEALLGMGDMLYLAGGAAQPVRVHGAFVSDDEVHRVVAYLKAQGEAQYVDGVLDAPDQDELDSGGAGGDPTSAEKDPLYDQAVNVVMKTPKPSISLVQRHLKIGYNRAARLVEQMQAAGLISAPGHNGQRELLVPVRQA